MIRVSITRDWGDGEISDRDEWAIEVDAAYAPDIVDDLQRRVSAMRTADRREMDRLAKENDE